MLPDLAPNLGYRCTGDAERQALECLERIAAAL